MTLPLLLRKFFFSFFSIWLLACNVYGNSNETTGNAVVTSQTSQTPVQKKQDRKAKKYDRQQVQNIPEKVFYVLKYVREHNKAPKGYVGGRRFGNFEKHLPLKDQYAKPMQYREWDVNPKIEGKNRGPERLVTSENDRAWYTADHYETFKEIK